MNHELKTEIYRKSLHLSSLWMPVFIYFMPRVWSLVLFGGGLILNLIIEYLNFRRVRAASNIFRRIFQKILRSKENNRKVFTPSGSVYVLAAAFLSCVFFPPLIAAAGLAVMLVSDTIAALVGKRFGRLKIYKKKSLVGSIAFFVSALIIVWSINGLSFSTLIACFLATMAELYEDRLKIDDNLSIPLIVSFVLFFL